MENNIPRKQSIQERGLGCQDQPEGIATIGLDLAEKKRIEAELLMRINQQRAVVELGHLALCHGSLKALLDETAVIVARALGVEFSKVLKASPDDSSLLLVAGVGWLDGLVGHAVVDAGLDSQGGYTLRCAEPVIVEDLNCETRFRGATLLKDHGIVAGISVVIGNQTRPWGVLSAHTSHRRSFTNDDITFVRSVVNVLGAAIAHNEDAQSLTNLSIRLMQVEDTERRRIAKELHDSTAQDLVAVLMNLEALRNDISARASGKQQLDDTIALVENAAHDIRTLSYLLHPPRLDEAGLIGAIRHYAAGFGERTGIATNMDLPANLERLPETVEMVLFRVTQECLGNIYRHAHSKTVFVRVEYDASGIVLEIRDEGRGISPQVLGGAMGGRFTGFGVGIPGMRERLRYIGGNLEIDSTPRGTTVRATVPNPSKIQVLKT
jgi:signal transduction histidine kinase